MSSNAIEKALWQAVSNPASARRFREDAQSYLQEFRMDDDERSVVASWNVGAMLAKGISALLLMTAFVTVKGMDKMPEYVQKMHQAGAAA